MGRLEGKIALITGAGSGVGRAAMQIFSKEGAKVVGVSRTQSALDETLKLVKAAGGKGAVVPADLATEAGAAKAMKATLDAFGRILEMLDVVVGIKGREPDHAAIPTLHPPHPIDCVRIDAADRGIEHDPAEHFKTLDVLADEPSAVGGGRHVVLEHEPLNPA